MKYGFTLIELLIVVSIISILALIAVINFQQAQVRSKVATVLSDHRTVATGLESYHTDHNCYPEDYAVDQPTGGYGMGRLTSPVAYLTTIPFDIFGGYIDRVTGKRVISYTLGTSPDPSPKVWMLAAVGPDRTDNTSPAFEYPGYSPEIFDQPTGPYRYLRYDPTNGTTSVGDIIRVSDAQDVMKQ